MIHLSSDIFHDLVLQALKSAIFLVLHSEKALVTDEFLEKADILEKKGLGIQHLLVPHIYNSCSAIRENAVLLLLNCWLYLPPIFIDCNATGLMYSLLYLNTWIFVAILDENPSESVVKIINISFLQLLKV
jgi:hypothetical protein